MIPDQTHNPLARYQYYDYNLLNWIVKSVPEYVCQLPSVTHTPKSGKAVPVSSAILINLLSSISKTWELSRSHGIANLYYDVDKNELIVSPGRTSRVGQPLRQGFNSSVVQIDDNLNPYLFYGIESPWRNIGFGIISDYLTQVVCYYQETLRHSTQRISTGYGEMVILGGTNTDDVPMLREVQQTTQKSWDEKKSILAPEGSSLDMINISLADLERVMRPTQEAIATEAGVPIWLLFPGVTDTGFELETRSLWGQRLFNRYVSPVMIGVLGEMGYLVTDIVPPSYRDAKFDADVKSTVADEAYKMSSTARNKSQVKQINHTIAQEKLGVEQSVEKSKPSVHPGRVL